MKIFEVLEHGMPHLYLDMDGVQADFFGKWARMHNVQTHKDVPNQEEAFDKFANSNPKRVYDFFRHLPPLPGGMKLVNWLRRNDIPFTVLSAPLRGPFADASIQAKKDWLDQYNPGTSNDAIFTGNKQTYATAGGKQNVLVDDFGKFLDAWSAANGIPIKFKNENAYQAISQLEKIYAPYLNK